MVTRNHRNLSKIPFLQSSSFDSKVKAINESNETNSNLMEEYQVRLTVGMYVAVRTHYTYATKANYDILDMLYRNKLLSFCVK